MKPHPSRQTSPPAIAGRPPARRGPAPRRCGGTPRGTCSDPHPASPPSAAAELGGARPAGGTSGRHAAVTFLRKPPQQDRVLRRRSAQAHSSGAGEAGARHSRWARRERASFRPEPERQEAQMSLPTDPAPRTKVVGAAPAPRTTRRPTGPRCAPSRYTSPASPTTASPRRAATSPPGEQPELFASEVRAAFSSLNRQEK